MNIRTIVSAKDDILREDIIGGKAYNLAKLSRNQIPVPEWFCVNTYFFKKCLESRQAMIETILKDIDYQSAESLENAFHDIKDIILSIEFQEKDLADFNDRFRDLNASFFAVRSSAVGEDAGDHSFAGILDTYLYIPAEDVLEHVKACWASAFNPRILTYLRLKEENPLSTRVAVVVQKMVDSRVAGVMFTANPTGSLNEAVIVAGYGLGEGIVSDRVETDTYIVNKTTGKQTSTIHLEKTWKVVRDTLSDKGTVSVRLDECDRYAPVLNSDQVKTLIVIGRDIEALYDHYQDIEWAMDESGQFHITQTRPITTIPQGPLSIFDNSNIVESYPGITMPLTFSFVKSCYETIFRNVVIKMGVSRKKVFAHQSIFKNMVGYVEGRVYYVISNWYQIFYMLPFGNRFARSWEEMAGVSERKNHHTEKKKIRFLKDIPSFLKIFGKVLFYFLSLRWMMMGFKKRFNALYREFYKKNHSLLSNHELATQHNNFFSKLMYGWEITLFFDFYAVIFVSLSKWFLKKLTSEEPDRLFNALLCSEKGMESVEPVRSIVSMAEYLRAHDEIFDTLKTISISTHGEKELAVFLASGEPCPFSSQFNQHMEKYGERSLEELKLETIVFKDSPVLLLKTVLSYVPAMINASDMMKKEDEIRSSAEEKLLKVLDRKPARRMVFSFLISQARISLKYRESSRIDRARAFGIVRTIFNQIGVNFSHHDIIDDKRDIHYLTVDEVLSFIYGTSVNSSLKWIVAERKKAHERFQKRRPLNRLMFKGTVYENVIPQDIKQKMGGADQPGMIKGTACSTGTVTAEAVIVNDPKTVENIEGKILVSEMTDPGWIFLMISAAGLIVEKGSILSHTAIIGRELGIPTIVGVENATQLIKTGSVICMDGETGEVRLNGL
ncbi:MAG: hypothetical protein KJ737_11630 [Proteobacteria bacterium]|nr:hypothetical protein [Pseudomonadota bacterium]